MHEGRSAPAGLRIKENKEVYEGEVTELTPEETENQVSWANSELTASCQWPQRVIPLSSAASPSADNSQWCTCQWLGWPSLISSAIVMPGTAFLTARILMAFDLALQSSLTMASALKAVAIALCSCQQAPQRQQDQTLYPTSRSFCNSKSDAQLLADGDPQVSASRSG